MGTLIVGDSYSNQNLFYKTRFLAGDPFVYLEADGRRTLVVGQLEKGRAEKESAVAEISTFEEYGSRELLKELNDRNLVFNAVLLRIIQGAGADHVVVGRTFPAFHADYLRGSGIAVEVDPSLLRDERRKKTADEIAAIEEAQRAAERAMTRAVEAVTRCAQRDGLLYLDGVPLTSERLRSVIDLSFVRDDMDTSGRAIVAGGPGATDAHWEGSGPLKAGQSIVLDLFPRSRRTRYFADMTRTIVKGEPGEQLRRMYDAVRRAQEVAIQQIRPGANGKDVHTAVEAVFAAEGFAGEGPGPRYTHGTGHGVGLNVHEPPALSTVDMPLEENDVVTVEPGLYDPDVGAVRLEDLIVVTRDGCRNLTRFPKQFVV